MPQTALAGLPRLVRAAAEVRWRGQSALGTAIAVAGFWLFSWLLDQPLLVSETLLAAGATALPTALVLAVTNGRRVDEALLRSRPPPSATIIETPAAGRERRGRLASVVLTGVIVLLLFDRLTDGGGLMAGLVTGLFAAVGVVDLREARQWDEAERRRDARLFLLVRPHALSVRFGAAEVFETPRPDPDRLRRAEPSPFDLR